MQSSQQLWANPIPDVPIEQRIPKEVAGVLQADFANRALLALREGQRQFGLVSSDANANIGFLVIGFFLLMMVTGGSDDRSRQRERYRSDWY